MATESFERTATLWVFTAEVGQKTGSPTQPGAFFIKDIKNDGLKFQSRNDDGSPGFRIKFTVNKVQQFTTNDATIVIYNLGKSSRSALEAIGTLVVLDAGYNGQSDRVFKGHVRRCRTVKEGPNYVTTIEASDGLFAYQFSTIDVSYKESIEKSLAIKTLLKSAADDGGLTIGHIDPLPTNRYNHGLVLSGKTLEQLTIILAKEDMYPTIQDGAISIHSNSGNTDDDPVVLNNTNGMIGSPQMGEAGRMTVKCLLNTKLKIAGLIEISSKFLMDPQTGVSLSTGGISSNGVITPTAAATAIYKILSVVHTGDTFSGDWMSTVEVG